MRVECNQGVREWIGEAINWEEHLGYGHTNELYM